MSLQILPEEKPSALTRLFSGLGTGLGEGLQTGVKDFFERKKTISSLTPILGEKNATAIASAPQEFRPQLFKSLLEQPKTTAKTKAAIGDAVTKEFKNLGTEKPTDPIEILKIRQRANEILDETGDPEAAQQAVQEFIAKDQAEEAAREEQRQPGFFSAFPFSPRAVPGFVDAEGNKAVPEALGGTGKPNIEQIFSNAPDAFQRGIKSGPGGRAGALVFGQSLKDFKKATELPDNATVGDQIQFILGRATADAPLFAVGAGLGAQVGGAIGGLAGSAVPVVGTAFGATAGAVIGGGAGGFGLPAFLDATLREFQEFKEGGGQGGFEEFVERGNRVSSETGESTLKGAMFGILTQALPALKQLPALKGVFEGSPGKEAFAKATEATIEATGLLGTEAVAKRKLPTKEDVASTLAQVLAFKLADVAPKFGNKILASFKKRGLNVPETAAKVEAAVKSEGIDINKVNQGDKAEQAKFERVVKDVTREFDPVREKTADVFEGEREDLKLRVKEREAVPVTLKEGKRRPTTILRETVIPQETSESLSRKRPETLVKEERRFQELTPKINQLNESIRQTAREINSTREAIEKQTKPEVIEKLRGREELALSQLKSQQKQLRALEKELKTGIPRKTEGQIRNEAQSSVEKLEARGGTDELSVKEKSAVKQTERDASRLRKQRKDTSNVPKDTFTRVNEGYKDFYEAKIDDLSDFIDKSQNSKSKAIQKRVSTARKTVQTLKDRIKGIDNKLTIHKHKLREIQEAKKLLDKSIKIEEKARGKRVERTAQEAIKDVNDFIKTPTEAKGESLAEEAGVELEETKKIGEEIAETLKDPESGKPELEEVFEKVDKLSKQKKNKKGRIVKGLIFGFAKVAVKRVTGLDLPARGAAAFLGTGITSIGGLVTWGFRQKDKIQKQLRIKTFQKALNSPAAIAREKENLRKKGVAESTITRTFNEAKRKGRIR